MRAFLGLGTNLAGDLPHASEQLIRACQWLAAEEGIAVTSRSRLFHTPAWGGVEQDDFYNAVIAVETELDPLDLLHRTQSLEQRAHRVREVHWGPRTLDIDVLACADASGAEIVSAGRWGQELILPHPYATRRGFVLVPWLDIAPEALVSGASVAQWAEELPAEETAGITPATSDCSDRWAGQ